MRGGDKHLNIEFRYCLSILSIISILSNLRGNCEELTVVCGLVKSSKNMYTGVIDMMHIQDDSYR